MTSRRTFTRILAAGAAMPLVALAETPPAAHALAEVVRAESGKYLSGEELAKIEKDFAESAPAIARLRDFKLSNGDEPDFTFHALARR